MSDGYMSYHIGTFKHVWFFCSKNERNALELASGATFAIAKSLYWFQVSYIFRSGILIFFRKCQMVTSTIIGTCHHEVNFTVVN